MMTMRLLLTQLSQVMPYRAENTCYGDATVAKSLHGKASVFQLGDLGSTPASITPGDHAYYTCAAIALLNCFIIRWKSMLYAHTNDCSLRTA